MRQTLRDTGCSLSMFDEAAILVVGGSQSQKRERERVIEWQE